MKRIILAILFLVVLTTQALGTDYAYLMGGRPAPGGAAASAATDSCTGGLVLSAHFENTDKITEGGVSGGVNNGCTTNADTTWSKTANMSYSTTQKSDGSYSIYCNACSTTDAGTIGVDINIDAGTLMFDIYVITRNKYSTIIDARLDANNWISCYFNGTETITCEYKGNGTTVYVTAKSYQLSADSWHSVVFKWRTGSTDPSLSIQVDANSAVTTNDDLTALTDTPTTLQVHRRYTGDNTFYLDKVKVYNAWQ